MLWGLTVLPEEESRRVLAAFDELADGARRQDVSEDEYRRAALELDELDKERQTLARTEQTFLRRQLFGNRQYS